MEGLTSGFSEGGEDDDLIRLRGGMLLAREGEREEREMWGKKEEEKEGVFF